MREQEPRSPLERSAEQNPRVADALQLLEQGFDRITSSDGFRAYLETMAKFHKYSPNNTMLIMMQRPDATRVAGYNRWKELGRQVKRGERAIKIFAPVLVKDPKELDEEGKPVEHLVGYTIASVFALEQTDGKPLPSPDNPKMLEGESSGASRLYDGVKAFIETKGVTVKRMPLPRESMHGVWSPSTREIVLSHRLHGDQAVKTLCHEAAHALAEHRGTIDRKDAETVAESTAFVACNHFGIDTSEYTFPYIVGWGESKSVLMRNLNEIQKISHQLIEGTEKQLKDVVLFDKPRGLSPDEKAPNRGLGGTMPQW